MKDSTARIAAIAHSAARSVDKGVAVLRRRATHAKDADASIDQHEIRNRWQVLTIHGSAEDVAPTGTAPRPIADLGDMVEWELRAAPGGKGTELAVRLREAPPEGATMVVDRIAGVDPRQDVRSALRETKQLIETGEVLRAHEPETSEATLINLPLRVAVERAGGEGRS